MMPDSQNSIWVLIILFAVLAHEPWRWAGLVVGRYVSEDSAVLTWVRAVSSALIAALVMRLIFFPAGDLADVAYAARFAAVGVAIAVYYATHFNLSLGVIAGAVTLALSAPLIP